MITASQTCHICKKIILHGVTGWGGEMCMCGRLKPTQEPVASRFKLSDGNYSLHNDQYDFGEPLYTHPAPSCNCKDKK